MATTTQKNWTKIGGWSSTGAPSVFYFFDSDSSDFGTINDKLRFNLPTLPQDVCLKDVQLCLGRFDSHATPTGTWSVRLTNGTLDYEIIKDATIGRLASHDLARPGGRTADELTGVGLVLTTDLWYIELEQTAAFATATSSARKISLMVEFLAVQ